MKNHQVSYDIANEAVYQAYSEIYDGHDVSGGYWYSAARNKVMDYLRSMYKKKQLEEWHIPGVEDHQRSDIQLASDILNSRLSGDELDLYQRIKKGHHTEAIALQYNITESAVSYRKKKLIEACRSLLSDYFPGLHKWEPTDVFPDIGREVILKFSDGGTTEGYFIGNERWAYADGSVIRYKNPVEWRLI